MATTTSAIEQAMENANVSEFTGIKFWDRPANKAADPSAQYPMTQEQKDRQTAFGHRLSALLTEGINSGDAGAFLTVSEKGTSILVAATVPMDPLTVRIDGEKEPQATNKWALNLNIAIPKEPKAKTETPTAVEQRALSLSDLRKFTAAKRAEKK